MAGYYGYSMSNNAMDAYDAGLKPLSKWRKSDILKAVKEWADENDYNFTLEKLDKVKVSVLKNELLFSSEWHHTSALTSKQRLACLAASVQNGAK